MRLMIMFDLPVETSEERKEYRKFRKNLINEGFIMIQYSVYVRVCVTEKRIESFLPSKGVVQSLILTEKQYNDMHFLLGKKIKEVRNSAERTIIL